MKKFPIALIVAACMVMSACSNPEEEAKKLGFSNAAEMKDIQGKGFKTMAEYSDDKKKKEELARKNNEKEIHNLALSCYNITAITASLTNSDSDNKVAKVSFYMAYLAGRKIGLNHADALSESKKSLEEYNKIILDSQSNPDSESKVLAKHGEIVKNCVDRLKNDAEFKKLYNLSLNIVNEPSNDSLMDDVLESYAGIPRNGGK